MGLCEKSPQTQIDMDGLDGMDGHHLNRTFCRSIGEIGRMWDSCVAFVFVARVLLTRDFLAGIALLLCYL